MNHLPHPETLSGPVIEVPFFGLTYSADNCIHTESNKLCANCEAAAEGWPQFPNRLGYKIKIAHLSTINDLATAQESREHDLNQVLQAWLFFGVLGVFLQDDFQSSDFVRVCSDGTKLLDTTLLPRKLHVWQSKINTASRDERENHLRNIHECFEFLNHLALWLAKADLSSNRLNVDNLIAIVAVWQTLDEARRAVEGVETAVFIFSLNNLFFDYRLKARGWCPMDFARLSPWISLYYFASLLEPRFPAKNHVGCTRDRCREIDVDESTYKTKHVSQDPECLCRFLSVSASDLATIIHQGKTPVVTLEDATSSDNLKLIGIEDADREHYVAISHVWADGLGNPLGNSLPICQLRRIQNEVNSLHLQNSDLPMQIPWYMDTLCIPRGSETDARKTAITRLRTTYQHASAVLVRDAEIMRLNLPSNLQQSVFHLVVSRWASRLWTLLEAVSASELYIQFASGIVRLNDIFEGYISRAVAQDGALPQDNLNTYLTSWTEDFFDTRFISNEGSRLDRAFSKAEYRNTSHEKDELICIAGVAEFSADKIARLLAAPDNEKTTEFIQIVCGAPAAVVVAQGPRIQKRGFRWCPQRLIGAWEPESFATSQSLHRKTDRGLQGPWSTIHLNFSGTSPGMDGGSMGNTDEARLLVDLEIAEPEPVSKMYEIVCEDITMSEFLQTYISRQMVLLFTVEPPIHVFDGILAKVLECAEGNLARRVSHSSIRKVPIEAGAEMRRRLVCVSGRQVLDGTEVWTID